MSQQALNYWFEQASKAKKALQEIKKVAKLHDSGERQYSMTDYEYIVKQCDKVLNTSENK